jgi:hypothetical protein
LREKKEVERKSEWILRSLEFYSKGECAQRGKIEKRRTRKAQKEKEEEEKEEG